MTTLNMKGHIDSVFVSTPANRIRKTGGAYVDGKWVDGSEVTTPHNVTLQPLTEREIQNLNIGAERIGDMRKVYVNDGDLYKISQADDWVFTGVDGVFKTVKLDNRPWRNYCKAIVSRYDDQ